ncbi:MAG: lamin tail domain-containing protein [Bacteroidota bacterium]|nr:lamin tail domain-containing protein [Bacteroidota bacterium]
MKKHITFYLLMLIAPLAGFSQACDLFFSEYLEGASNNKAIEIYNPTSSTINLTDYIMFRYNNGSPIPTDSLYMQGTLAPGAVYVAGNPSAVAGILAVSDTLHTITFFNGDDAMALCYKPTRTMIDVVGLIGNDPGTNWPVGTGATSEFTLVRMAGVTYGNTNWATGATEWDVYPQNTTTFLGNHTSLGCCPATTATISPIACGTYTSPSGNVWTVSNTYNDTIPNVAGCDSIITINLTVLAATANSFSVTACGMYTSPSGNVWTVSNTYNDTIPNVAGCDSVITIDLTINAPTANSFSATACGSYTSPSGNVWTVSNTYNDTIPNAVGCDSIITINLTINDPTANSFSVTACGSYTSPSGNVWTVSNTYNDTIPNAAGCDSVITINLTINTLPSVTVSGSLASNECEGSIDTLIANGALTYLWNTTETNDTLIITHAPGVLSWEVVGTDVNGCTDTIMATVVNVYPLDPVSIDLGVIDSLCVNNSLVALATSSPAGGTWSGTGVTGSDFDPAIAGIGVHTIVYTIIGTGNCTNTATDSIFVSGCIGLEDYKANANLVVFPNPSTGNFTLHYNNDASFVLINEFGQSIQHILLNAANNYSYTFSNLDNGIYFITGMMNGHFVTQKIVITK